MKTLAQVLEEAEKLGAECTERTFWKYHKLRLLPKGQKKSGGGNLLYFPNDTALRIWIIQLLTKELEFSLSDISQYPWSQFEVNHSEWRPNMYPGELVLETKNQYDKLKGTFLRQVIDKLVEELKSGTHRR